MITEFTVLEKGRLMQYEFENLEDEAKEFEKNYDKGKILRKKHMKN